jgi:hypothetical protein
MTCKLQFLTKIFFYRRNLFQSWRDKVFKESRKPWQVLQDRWKLKKKNAGKEYSPAVFRQCHEKAKRKWTRRNPGKEFGSDDDSKLFVDALLYQASKEAENRVSVPLLLHQKKPTGMQQAQSVSSTLVSKNCSMLHFQILTLGTALGTPFRTFTKRVLA